MPGHPQFCVSVRPPHIQSVVAIAQGRSLSKPERRDVEAIEGKVTSHATTCGRLKLSRRATHPGRSASTADSASRSGLRCGRLGCDRSVDTAAPTVRGYPHRHTATIVCPATAAVPAQANDGSSGSPSHAPHWASPLRLRFDFA